MSDLLERSLTPAVIVETQTMPGLCAVYADKGQLELAILNLAINARDAMPNGGTICISARPASVDDAAAVGDGEFVAVAVADTGIGMDARTMRQARDPFFTTKPLERGTGLGLSMVDGFAAQSGGVLQLTSEVGVGTIATMILPCSIAIPADARPVGIELDLQPVRVLLVDDEDAVRRATADMLADAGHEVLGASSVDAALGILEGDQAFDVIVTDYVMPGRSGGELVAIVRQRWREIPILLASGYVTDEQDLPHDLQKLTKPFNRDELINGIKMLLLRSKA
jgi:CheY-like chemotaxis protein/anti-sigma regulatory factor (Ser/Thr protein kinase)